MLLLILLTGLVSSGVNNEIIQRTKNSDTTPDMIDEIEANGKDIKFDSELTPIDNKNEATLNSNVDPTKYCSLIMMDSDTPSKEDPKFRETNHWLVEANCESNLPRLEATAQNFNFGQHKVVPDVIDESPTNKLEVSYNKIAVNYGDILTPTEVKTIPKLFWPSKSGAYYLICMTDPDAPSRQEPKFREWNHWLVGNIPNNEIEKGDTLSEYIGAGPPKGTGLHRYVILVYKQPSGKIDFTETRLKNSSGKGRGKFSIRKFAEKYSLGRPVAGNFFQAEWDNYVPILHQQLKN